MACGLRRETELIDGIDMEPGLPDDGYSSALTERPEFRHPRARTADHRTPMSEVRGRKRRAQNARLESRR
jgi:hypothetical protein